MEYLPAKTILTPVKKPNHWFGYDYNMNLYRGCCHGCIYCDSRSDCYRNDRFDTVRAKQDALRILDRELLSRRTTGVVGMGSMSDPYNPFEEELKLTRQALRLLNLHGFGVSLATKSCLVTRDKDLLRQIQEHSPVLVKVTITAADDGLGRKIEPHAPSSSRRFEAIRELAAAGIYTGVLLMPVLPWITDSEENILNVVRMAGEAGARFVYPAFGMTMRTGQREYFYASLEKEFPGLRERYEKRYGFRYQCAAPRAEALWRLFEAECRKLGLRYRMQEIIRDYRSGHGGEQLGLFGFP